MALIPDRNTIINSVKSGASKAYAVAGKAKDGAVDSVTKMRKDMAIKKNQPVWRINFEHNDIYIPSVIRIIDEEDKRFHDPGCEEAIGFRDRYPEKDKGGIDVLCVSGEYLDIMDIRFLPNSDSNLYHRHPFLSDTFIDLDQYFSFIQTRRVSELQEIARMLGAKHVKVSLEEEKKRFLNSNATAKAKVKGKKIADVNANARRQEEKKEYQRTAIEADTTFEGSSTPKRPELVFFQHEDEILNLINARMSGDNNVLSKKLSVHCDHSIGMKLDEAIAIDYMLDKLKLKGDANATFRASVEQEARSILQYEMEF